MLRALRLVDVKFLLGQVFVAKMDIILAETIMRIGQDRVQFESSLILRNRVVVLVLI